MDDGRVHLYEGLFIISQAGGSDPAAALAQVSELLARIEAEVVLLQKWDDRRLAYPIRGQKRGLYVLAYFRAHASRLVNLERDCNLSEHVLRLMAIRADHIGEVELEVLRKEAETKTEARLRSSQRPDDDEADRDDDRKNAVDDASADGEDAREDAQDGARPAVRPALSE
jgi:small subunit ribosomal protein S6